MGKRSVNVEGLLRYATLLAGPHLAMLAAAGIALAVAR